MITVTIKQTYGERQEFVSRHRTTDKAEAIERAVKRNYGRAAHLEINHQLTGRVATYGQVFKPVKGDFTLSSTTGQLCITVEGTIVK